jgi:hypothetical protein
VQFSARELERAGLNAGVDRGDHHRPEHVLSIAEDAAARTAAGAPVILEAGT